ncbi:hypothetical protein RJ639_041579 [Escallonia herrerae]|uniref:BED-type domain-containing protein n=1 Tax=Escallonia herrerae TaxID=1293975 RepID=A0AA89B4G4_9ASTE|nr:hypothetical protein RJ639_041579 [Escallonia herrerae]
MGRNQLCRDWDCFEQNIHFVDVKILGGLGGGFSHSAMGILLLVMEVVKETPVKKPKRLTSVVWNHFERVRKADICHAVCLHCNKKLSGSSNSGTTHLRNHLIRCLKRSNHDVSQLLSAKRKRSESARAPSLIKVDATQRKGEDYFIASKRKDEDVVPISSYKFDQEQKKDETINLGSVKFDQERSRLDLAHMIMLHGYPLAFVEDVGFKEDILVYLRQIVIYADLLVLIQSCSPAKVDGKII